MNENKIEADLTLPLLKIEQPKDHSGFWCSANDFHNGMIAISNSERKDCALSCAFLAAFSIECYLKAYLNFKDPSTYSPDKLKNPREFSHSLAKLWDASKQNGLTLISFPESEVEALTQDTHWLWQLNDLHTKFILRYPLGFHIIGTPNMRTVIKSVDDIRHQINLALQ